MHLRLHMIDRSFVSASIICAFFALGSLAMEKANRDLLARDLHFSLNIMQTCAVSYKQNQDFEVESDEPEKIYDKTHEELKNQLERYTKYNGGITKPDLWKVYAAAVQVVNLQFDDFLRHRIKIDFEHFPDYTLEKLAQN